MASEEVYRTLRYACSQNPDELRAGEQQLKQWEQRSGYYAELASVFRDRAAEPVVRWMAITCLKNGIDRYWRVNAPHELDRQEKQIIRSSLLQSMEEPHQQTLLQLAVLVAKIARLDYPSRWPELLPALAEGVQSQSRVLQKCSIFILKEVIKSLASRRIMEQRVEFFELTGNLFSYVSAMWTGLMQSVGQLTTKGDHGGVAESLLLANTCLKTLQIMLLHGFHRFHTNDEAVALVKVFHVQVPLMLELRKHLTATHLAHSAAEKAASRTMKTLYKLQYDYAIGYVPFLSDSLCLIYETVFFRERRDQMFEEYVVYALHLMKNILSCELYQPPQPDVTPLPQVLEAQRVRAQIFEQPGVLQEVLKQLVTEYMLLSDDELSMWQDSPEEFGASLSEDSVGQQYQFSLRGCVERVYMIVVRELQPTAAPMMVSTIQSVQETGAGAPAADLLLKEAVYNAAGLAACELYEYIDYDSWYSSQLLQEMSVTDPGYKIVRRRVVSLLGCWVNVKMSAELLPSLYEALLVALHPREDIVIRLTAANSLRQAIDDVMFSANHFSRFLPQTMELLLQLLQDVKESDTRLQVMKVFSLIVEQSGPEIRPHLPELLRQLPQIWSESSGESSSLLRCSIVVTLVYVVEGLGPLSEQLHDFLIPIIKSATNVEESEHIYLAEDGLNLWLALLSNARQPSLALVQLVSNLVGLLGLSPPSDISSRSMPGIMDLECNGIKQCFKILDAYVLLCVSAPDLFMEHCAEVCGSACRFYLRDLKPEAVCVIVEVLDHMVVAFPHCFDPVVRSSLVLMLHFLLQGEEDDTRTVCTYLALIARVLLHSPEYMLEVLSLMAQESQKDVSILLGILIDIWSDKLECMADDYPKKLCALAACTLLTVNNPCVTERFELLLDMCVSVLHDLTEATPTGYTDVLVMHPSDVHCTTTIDTEHSKRLRQLQSMDPVKTVPIHEAVADKLQKCFAALGPTGYTTLVMGVDAVIREQLSEFLPPHLASAVLVMTT